MSFIFLPQLASNHLIVFETNHLMTKAFFTSSRHVRLPVPPPLLAAPAFPLLRGMPRLRVFVFVSLRFVSGHQRELGSCVLRKKEEGPGCEPSTLGAVRLIHDEAHQTTAPRSKINVYCSQMNSKIKLQTKL